MKTVNGRNIYTNAEKIEYFERRMLSCIKKIRELQKLDPNAYEEEQDWTSTVQAYIRGKKTNVK